MAEHFRESLLADLVHTVYICFFYLMQVPRSSLKVFITMFYFCWAAVVVQVNAANNIQYL